MLTEGFVKRKEKVVVNQKQFIPIMSFPYNIKYSVSKYSNISQLLIDSSKYLNRNLINYNTRANREI